jgi:hypothetical protein
MWLSPPSLNPLVETNGKKLACGHELRSLKSHSNLPKGRI